MNVVPLPSLWLGPYHHEARAAFLRARAAGLSPLRALVVGCVASFKDCWAFRKRIAKHLRCSIRTVGRALEQAAQEGLIGRARAKKGEIPPQMKEPLPCGWSHRWTIGWGKAGQAVADAVQAARARWLVQFALRRETAAKRAERPTEPKERPRREGAKRRYTAAELDAELAELDRQRAAGTPPAWDYRPPPPEPDP